MNDVAGKKGEPVVRQIDIMDIVMIKGLSVVRSENAGESEYHKFMDIDEMGVMIYTPHAIQNPENFVDPEQNKTMYEGFNKVMGAGQ